MGVQRCEIVVECIDEHAEGNVSLQLGCATLEHQVAAGSGVGGRPVEQRRLSDPGLARQ